MAISTPPVPVRGLFETHLTVSDLERAVAFYRDVVGLALAYEVPERGAAFLWIGEPGQAMLGPEPSVIGWMPAAAVYFRDPDGHRLEYLAMLDEEPRPDRGIVPWSQWARQPTGTGEADARSNRAAAVVIKEHAGPRAAVRSLFLLAEDSPEELDSYIDDGRVLVALEGDRTARIPDALSRARRLHRDDRLSARARDRRYRAA